jgi:hypothetical protein
VAALSRRAGHLDSLHGAYRHAPDWYRNFLYTEEAARGLDCIEDLASPGVFTFDLAQRDAALGARAGSDIAADPRGIAAGRSPASASAAARSRAASAPPTRSSCKPARAAPSSRATMVHRLGPRHVHRDARLLARARTRATSRR